MRTVGLLGGMSWESSALYYRYINAGVRKELGAFANARSFMLTLDFAEIERLQHANEWARLGRILGEGAAALERGGADCVVLCTNTMHKVASWIEESASIPLLHIVDATAQEVKRLGVRRAALLGTRFTMEDGFYQLRMKELFGIDIVVPDEDARVSVHRIIYEELCQGELSEESRSALNEVISRLADRDASAVILGCTELGLLMSESDFAVPVIDSTRIHAEEAVKFCLHGATAIAAISEGLYSNR